MKTTQNNGRMYRYCMLGVVLLSLSAVSVRATTPLVQNGGFETGDFTSWTLSANTNRAVVQTGFLHSGTYGAEFGEIGLLGYLSQSLTTVTGQVYRLSFWLYSEGGSPAEFNVAWNGGTLMELVDPPAAGWSNYVFTVTATSTSTVLQFGFQNNPNFFYLDDVSVTPVGVGLTFDDMPNNVSVPNGYGGLNWSGFSTLDGVNFFYNPSGYEADVVSTNNVIWAGTGSMTSTNPFNLYSAYLAGAWNDNLQVEAKGYVGGVLVYDTTNILSATNRTLINFNYLGVTEVDFYAYGGTQHPGYLGSGQIFAMDNVNVTTGPGVESNPQLSVPLPGPLMGQAAYVRSINGEPWGVNDNIVAMNRVFGSNAWQSLYFETVNPATLFSPTVHSIFMDGSDVYEIALSNFLSANLSTIQSWVSNGGSLFVNASPYFDISMNFGFGVTLNCNGLQYTDYSGAAANPLNPIFNGPFAPVGTSWYGNSFLSRASVSGTGLIPVIVNPTNSSEIILGEMVAVGQGHVLFGGMNAPYFIYTQPQGSNLLANVLAYMNNSPEIVFDDLLLNYVVTNGYRGLLWSNFETSVYIDENNGITAGTVSPDIAVFNGAGDPEAIKSATPFNFVSAWLTGVWNDNLQVEVRGYARGFLMYDQTYTLSATAPTLIVFNYLGVTEVDFISFGGTQSIHYPSGPGGTAQFSFAMDNVTVGVPAVPQLTIAPGAGSAVVSWSSPSTGWSLQQTSNLTSQTWTSPLETINDGGTNKFIVVSPLTGGNEFYRLIYQ